MANPSQAPGYLNGEYPTTLYLGSNNSSYGPTLTIGSLGLVLPSVPNAYGVVDDFTTGASLTNYGSINGAPVGGGGSKLSGAGVYLVGGPVTNKSGGTITGGNGSTGYSGGPGAYLRYSGSGFSTNYGSITGGTSAGTDTNAVGVIIAKGAGLFNQTTGTITGGTAGGGATATGGAGIVLGIGGYGLQSQSADIAADSALVLQYGTVTGGAGGLGGDGVDIRVVGDYLINQGTGTIRGGAGSVGSGGVGVSIDPVVTVPSDSALIINVGTIEGGAGGTSGANGSVGGNGVDVTGAYAQLQNVTTSNSIATIEGGQGGAGQPGGTGGTGGLGVSLSGGAVFNNGGGIVGGTGGSGYTWGDGGAGVDIGTGATLTNEATGYAYVGHSHLNGPGVSSVAGSITGGAGGSADQTSQVSGAGGVGGSGVVLSGTLTNDGTITGGSGGAGNAYKVLGGAHTVPVAGNGGVGVLVDGGSLTNTASITGGVGGTGGVPNGFRVAPGYGGDGVVLGTGSTFANTGSITGGAGGDYGTTTYAGGGGIGLDVAFSPATLTNQGSITGGQGFTGGSGITLTLASASDTFTNDGHATGGAGSSTGGVGILLSGGGTVNNVGYATGGAVNGSFSHAGAGIEVAAGATSAVTVVSSHAVGGAGSGGAGGGIGIDLLSATSLTNNHYVNGGAGSNGSSGGDGVDLRAGGTLDNFNGHAITGGNVTSGSGTGGDGVYLVGGKLIDNYQAYISGGYSTSGHGGEGAHLTGGASATVVGTITGGQGLTGGGIGVDLGTGASLTTTMDYNHNIYTRTHNNIYGGASGSGAGGTAIKATGATVTLGAVAIGEVQGGVGYGTGSGGIGVALYSGSTLTNDARIFGGYLNPSTNTTVSSGTGLVIDSGSVATNDGTVSGGTVAVGANGGAGLGVYIDGGTLNDAGQIEGGNDLANLSRGLALQFGSAHDSTVNLSGGWGVLGNISGFAVGDRIDIAGVQINSTNEANFFNSATDTLYTDGISNGSSLQTLAFVGDAGKTFNFTSDGSGGTFVTIACYLRGTRIATPNGERPIEDLRIGDQVLMHTGQLQPIRWIGRRRYAAATARDNRELQPVRIARGALAPDVPTRPLRVSPEHALFIDGMLIPAAALVNGTTITHERLAQDIEYFHLEFDTHAIIYAEGAPAESFVDDDSRGMFDNAAEYARRYPDTPAPRASFCAPRVEYGPELEQVRRRLAQGLADSRADPSGLGRAPAFHSCPEQFDHRGV